MIEKRASPRHRVLKQGTIAFRGGGGIDCMVRNISQSGARLEIASPIGLPDSFTLVIAADRLMRDCRAVWNAEKSASFGPRIRRKRFFSDSRASLTSSRCWPRITT